MAYRASKTNQYNLIITLFKSWIIGNNLPAGVNLSGVDLSSIVFTNGQLLSDCNFYRTDFSGANLSGCHLENSNCSKASFLNAQLAATRFDSAILSSCDLSGANASSAVFTVANLFKANFNKADLSFANLSQANLSSASFLGCTLNGANLSNANIAKANFSFSNLSAATLPANANTKTAFKSIVGKNHWHPTNTLWTDGAPIGA